MLGIMMSAAQGGTWVGLRPIAVMLVMSGCGGSDGDPRFVARMVGDEIVVDVAAGDEVHYRTCRDEARLEKRVGATWTRPQDDRPPSANNPGYFLDGKYMWPSFNLGCDYILCAAWDETFTRSVARAAEYVKVGTRDKPAYAPANAASPVDVIESRPLSGELRVRITYSKDAECSASEQATAPITVPQDGVCCPIGLTQCSSDGPGGGWAPTLDACPEWSMGFDVGYMITTDIRGCERLIEDNSACCGCVPDAGNDASTDQDAGF
jgi:hypothetical protein